MTITVALYHPSLAERYASLLSDRWPDLVIRPAADASTAKAALVDAEILLAHISFPPALLDGADHLRWIQMLGAGVDRIVPFVRNGVQVSRLTGSFGERMAEYVLAYVFTITQRVPEVLQQQRAGEWSPLKLGRVRGLTLGVAGLGSIGSSIAELGANVGMRVIATSTRPAELPALDNWYPAGTQFHDFLAETDVLVLALPSTPVTHHIINQHALSAMKPGAWLINVSRGPLVDEPALVTALQEGKPAGAVLDVFDCEPLPREHPFWEMSNVIVTPHHSGAAIPEEGVDAFGENFVRYLAGERLINEVDLARGY